jgi:hypothetical protein
LRQGEDCCRGSPKGGTCLRTGRCCAPTHRDDGSAAASAGWGRGRASWMTVSSWMPCYEEGIHGC